MKSHPRFAFLLAGLLCALSARADPAPELTQLINRYRAEAPACQGRDGPPPPPLSHDGALARVEFDGGASLPAALDKARYLSGRAQAIVITGASDAGRAMGLLRQRYCAFLLDPGFSRIAVTRAGGGQWRVLLAQPLLANGLGGWRDAGQEVLAQVNLARSLPRRCGTRRFAAAPPLRWNQQLGDAALLHSQDMARHDYFDHRGRDGSDVGQRATRRGYRGGRIGENIATGHGEGAAAVAGWVTSPGHCANLMDPAFTEMGAAYAVDAGSRGKIYWTQVLGAPR